MSGNAFFYIYKKNRAVMLLQSTNFRYQYQRQIKEYDISKSYILSVIGKKLPELYF